MALAQRPPQSDPRRRPTARALRRARPGRPWRRPPAASTGGGLLPLWRQGTDSSLSKGPTEEEVNDNRNLMARWLTPKKNPHSDPDRSIRPRP